jgi:O-acetyl-ADP-ribose deacetylase (regulator of RNase III)
MIRYVDDDIFDTGCEALVNTVNCVGVCGKGIALGVKLRWPRIYAAYQRDCGIGLDCNGTRSPEIGPRRNQRHPDCCHPGGACRMHQVRPGTVYVRRTGGTTIRWAIDVPTKRHWYANSKLSDIQAGLVSLVRAIDTHGIGSIAVPPLGCGNGGLDWAIVGPIVATALAPLVGVDIRIHAPDPGQSGSRRPDGGAQPSTGPVNTTTRP